MEKKNNTLEELNTVKRKKLTDSSFSVMLIGAAIMVFAAIVTGILFMAMMSKRNLLDMNEAEEYSKHYVYIISDKESDLWINVLNEVKAIADESNIYIEDIEETMGVNYSDEDLLRVAVNSGVDGIIYSGIKSEKVMILIDKAVTKGMAVVVLQNDIDSSIRQCFIGVNNYELGRLYASQIKKIATPKQLSNMKIELLTDADMTEGSTNLISLAMEEKLEEYIGDYSLPEVKITRLSARDMFSAEEDIRNFFVGDKKLPDIIICLNDSYTKCVYQALVDYNRVGEVQIIGYYSDDTILEAVDKGIIYSTVSPDTEKMGELCMKALEEYCETGYTNAFMSVNAKVIGRDEARELLNERQNEQTQD
ncbi:MAG: substrate-binding domain-containing protein [Lachnospiraceae bacterium]|nr:substrate-binding domain-containing protein [Candidatus Colinaster equi]